MEKILALLAFIVAATVVSQPHAASGEERAVLLVANPKVAGGWSQTVLIATPSAQGFHIGLIVNRPSERSLSSLFPEHEPSRNVLDPVFFGGPHRPDMLVALVKGRPQTPSAQSLLLGDNLYIALQGETIDQVIETAPGAARFYVGLVLWQPGELEEEVKAGYWSVHRASEATLFSADAGHLWKSLQVRGNWVSLPEHLAALSQASP